MGPASTGRRAGPSHRASAAPARKDAAGWGADRPGEDADRPAHGEAALMLWLASRDSLYEAAGAPWPTSLPIAERAVLFDGLAALRLGWNSNLFSLQIPIPASTIRVIGVAGWSVNRPLTAAEAG